MPRTKKPAIRLVHFLLDETGSMGGKTDEVVEGFNGFLDEFDSGENTVRFALTKFDSNHQTLVHDYVPIQDVPRMHRRDFHPGAMTPLYDATAECIAHTQKMVKEYGADSAMIISMTDGFENASKEYDKETLAELIKEQEGIGWEFIYLGISKAAWSPQNLILYKGTRAEKEGRIVLDSGEGSGQRTMSAATASASLYASRPRD